MITRFARHRVGNQHHVRKLLGLIVAVVLAALLPVGAAGAQENDATAVNTKDGKSVFKLAFQVKKTMDSDVDATNTAAAFASCEDCKTVAGAIQVVLVTEEPTSVDAENVAVAINYQCSECETLAAAYQFVFGTGDNVRFTPEGRQRLNALKQEYKALKHRDDLTLAQLSAEMAKIAAQVVEVVDDELVPVGPASDPATTSTSTSSSTTSSTVPDDGPASTTTTLDSTTTTSSP